MFVIDPALNPDNYVLTKSFATVSKWKAKIFAANNGGEIGDMDNVGYVMISKTRNTIIPIARNDEHHVGYDMLHDLNSKRKQKVKINISDYVSFWCLGDNYIYDKADIPLYLTIIKKYFEYGGKDGVLYGTNDLRNVAITYKQFLELNGNIAIKKGKLALIGQMIYDQFLDLSAAITIGIKSGIVEKRLLLDIQRKALLLVNTIASLRFKILDVFSFEEMEKWPGMIKSFVEEEDLQGLEKMFFGFHGIKNKLHLGIKEDATQKDYMQRLTPIFGDLKLAIDMFGRM